MAINPLTWQDEELTSVDGSSSVFKNQNNELTTGLTPINPTDNSNEFTESEQNLADTLNNFNIEDEPTEIVAKTPTKTDAVVIWDETIGGQESTSIFDGLTWDKVKSEISSGTDLGKKLLKEIQNRRNLEWVTWSSDSILADIGFSTVKEEDKVASTVSGEVALNIVDALLAWDKDILPVTGDPIFNVLRNDKKLTDQLTQQWYSAEEIQAVKNARDTRLKEQRVSKDATTLIEDREEELRKRVEREQATIREQSERSQNLLQRQRALRGVGLSTATEWDIADMVKQADILANAAQTKANNELALFKAQAEWAEAETISKLRENFNESVKVLNGQILQQTELENKLIQQGKLESEAGFNNLVESLKVAWVDTEVVDQGTSELTGRLSDKFGNAILIDGKTFPVWGGTADNAAAINKWAKDIAQGITDISTVPSKLRSQVQSVIAAGFDGDESILDASQIADSRAISKTVFGNDKTSSVNAVKALMQQGLSNEQIIRQLSDAGFNEDYQWALRNGFQNVVKNFPQGSQVNMEQEFNRRIEEWDDNATLSYLLTMARDSVPAEAKNKINWVQWMVRNIAAIQDGFTKLMTDPEAKELFKTGKITGTSEQIAQALGNTTNPDLATIWSEINQAIINYRSSKSGAAFSESEAKAYDAIFPGGWKSMELNAALIDGIINAGKRDTESFYEDAIGSNEYGKVFNRGVLEHIYPSLNLSPIVWQETTTTTISTDSTDDELNNFIFGGNDTVEETTTTTISTDSTDEDLNSFIFGGDKELQDFNTGDLTSWSKVWISDIGLWNITQNFWDTSPLSIDNIELANWEIWTPWIDIDWKIWDRIPSPINGVVKEINKSSTWLWNSVIIEDNKGNLHYFNHLDKKTVNLWDNISAGQIFWTMWNSGSVIKWSWWDWSHLDYRVKSSEGWIDPNQFLL